MSHFTPRVVLLFCVPLVSGFSQMSVRSYTTRIPSFMRRGGQPSRSSTTAQRWGGNTKMVASESAESTKTEGVVLNPNFAFNMEDVVGLCKRRGFVFQSSEIYNGFNGFYDYGPLGCELKQNIKRVWWRDMVHRREDMVGLDSSIIAAPAIWKSSGHVDGFSDPMVDCKVSKLRYRADQLFYGKVELEDGSTLGYVSVLESGTMQDEANKMADKMKRKAAKQGALKPIVLKEVAECSMEELPLIPSPATGEPGSLTPPRAFNLMFQTQVGALSDASSVAYLRPETAQVTSSLRKWRPPRLQRAPPASNFEHISPYEEHRILMRAPEGSPHSRDAGQRVGRACRCRPTFPALHGPPLYLIPTQTSPVAAPPGLIRGSVLRMCKMHVCMLLA